MDVPKEGERVHNTWNHVPSRRFMIRVGAGLMVLALIASASPASATTPAQAAAAPQSMTLGEHLKALAAIGKNYLGRMRPEVVARLSSGGEKLIKLAQMGPKLDQMAEAAPSLARTQRAQGPRAARAGFANDVFAAEDLFSRLAGMTQSETSAAWCGKNAVIGFNDSGSFIATAFLGLTPSGSLSFNGWAQSTDGGRTYTDRGALVAEPIPANLAFRDLLGDPVVGCTSSSQFYYASLAFDTGPDNAFANSGIAVSPSSDGGATFTAPAIAVSKDANLHFLDKPWFAVEPGPTSSPADDVLHVTYTDFDVSGFDGQGPCPDEGRTGIEYVRSTDGGQTWSAPLVLEEVCDSQGFLQGSQVEPGLADDVFVAWERFPFDLAELHQIAIRRSTNLGASFAPAAVAATVTPVGDSFALQGNFRAFIDIQALAVDRTSGSRRGAVYLTYHDGSARQKPDPLGLCLGEATYCFSDAEIVRSADSGATWSAPVRINNDDIRLGIDQWFPHVEVDRSGVLWAVFYDRRRDERNLLIDTFVARSTNGGATWTNVRATANQFPAITGWEDILVNPAYMGDYIAIAADATGRNRGVIAAWGDNGLGDANVVQRKFE